ncbi:MAG: hypothetical protein K1Y36_26875 [Blastocatellia bacterium]|nr:hypothetical protein [Blastocatellia bacterium]
MWRHGDVLIAATDSIPEGAHPRKVAVLAYGELTGHSHRLEVPDSAELWESKGTLYLKVVAASATVVHEEHKPITIPAGVYRVWMQREYTPQEIRRILD